MRKLLPRPSREHRNPAAYIVPPGLMFHRAVWIGDINAPAAFSFKLVEATTGKVVETGTNSPYRVLHDKSGN